MYWQEVPNTFEEVQKALEYRWKCNEEEEEDDDDDDGDDDDDVDDDDDDENDDDDDDDGGKQEGEEEDLVNRTSSHWIVLNLSKSIRESTGESTGRIDR